MPIYPRLYISPAHIRVDDYNESPRRRRHSRLIIIAFPPSIFILRDNDVPSISLNGARHNEWLSSPVTYPIPGLSKQCTYVAIWSRVYSQSPPCRFVWINRFYTYRWRRLSLPLLSTKVLAARALRRSREWHNSAMMTEYIMAPTTARWFKRLTSLNSEWIRSPPPPVIISPPRKKA